MKQIKGSVVFHSFEKLPHISAVSGNFVKNEFPDHVHESLCLGMCVKGDRIINCCGEEFIIPEKGLFLIPANTPHSCSSSSDENHSYRILVIKPDFIEMVYDEMSPQKDRRLLFKVSEIKDVFLEELMEDFFLCLLEDEDQLRLSELTYEITARLISGHASAVAHIDYPISGEKCARKAARYIDKNWDRPINLEELGKEAGMSPYHLLRIFRKVMGITPHAYLLQTRIKNAVQLLSKGMTLADVAQAACFTDQSHFTKVFRKQVGVTPGLFQDENR